MIPFLAAQFTLILVLCRLRPGLVLGFSRVGDWIELPVQRNDEEPNIAFFQQMGEISELATPLLSSP